MSETVRLPRGGDREAFRGAAYRLLERAHVRLDLKGGTLVAVLTARPGGGKGLAKAFWSAYEGERRRASIRARGRAAEAALLAKALTLAAHADAKRAQPDEALPPEVDAEITALLAEAEAAPTLAPERRRNWEDLRRKGGA
ncbi:MAG: hypothetical protein SF051_15045 [Elusimicrobiota bacterium]|nr:hypothetical protein [Elusimicrobiota bacterium]